MAGHQEPPVFAKARQTGKIIVDEPPKVDLEAYLANYKGRTRFERLMLIGTTSTYLHQEALKAAVAEAKKGEDVGRYEHAVATLAETVHDDEAIRDDGWVEKTKKRAKIETDKMEAELKGYKNNLIKESIRMGYQDLGRHYHNIGDLANSNKAFSKMRDFCTTNSHIVIMSLHLITLSIDQQNWFAVSSNVTRIRNGGSTKYPEAEKQSAKLTAALGVSQLASGNYREAAREFLSVDPRMAQAKMDDPTDDESFNEVLTPNDIAIYGGLCALASMNRDELQRQVLEHKTFRNYLELEPHIRRAISFFVSSKYSACLSILENWKADYLLDIYLHSHLQEIYFLIRSKAIRQYFIPFSCVTLKALALAFNTDETTIEVELTQMIKRGNLEASIDLVDRVLLAREVDARSKVQAQALATAKDYERTAHLRILRMAVLNAGLDVKAARGQGLNLGSSQQEDSFNGIGAGDLMGVESQGRSGLRSHK